MILKISWTKYSSELCPKFYKTKNLGWRKKEREEEKEKREANEKASGSSDHFSFLSDKDNTKEKKKRPGNEKEVESKRSRSEPAERNAPKADIPPEDDKMED